MDSLGDGQLVNNFRELGEMRYFDELVRRHISKVRAIIYPMVLNDADADELTQEVFMKVINNISRFKGKAKFSTWLYRITVNTVKTFYRSNSRNPIESRALLPEQVDLSQNPSGAMAVDEVGGKVGKALAGLSPVLRTAIVMTGINGLSIRDAAKAAGCVTATMYWRVHEARRILKGDLLAEV